MRPEDPQEPEFALDMDRVPLLDQADSPEPKTNVPPEFDADREEETNKQQGGTERITTEILGITDNAGVYQINASPAIMRPVHDPNRYLNFIVNTSMIGSFIASRNRGANVAST